jgi:two-component system LytT family response regulator
MHKILIVDDERPARDYLAELVTFCLPDSKVVKADNAERALACLQTDSFDLLFVDIEMPGMTGFQLLENMQNEFSKHIPFAFIISAFHTYKYALQGFRLGILDYIEKPFHHENIYNAVKLYLNTIKSETIAFKVAEGFCRIRISQLVAIQTIGRNKALVYTNSAILKDVSHTLCQLYAQLPSNFRYIRRDCIVNIHEIKSYNLKARNIYIICQNNEYALTVSRQSMKEIIALL